MRDLNRVIVHCAATKGDVSAAKIRTWHELRGWSDIGYHDVIRTNGDIEKGRPIERIGAHVKGHNKDSIGICLAGGQSGNPDYTDAQWHSLALLVLGYCNKYAIPLTEVYGHNNFTDEKTCPNFDVKEWAEELI